MKRTTILSLIFVALFTGCQPGAAPRAISGVENLVVDAPTLQVGDECRYTGGTVGSFRRVIGFENGLAITVSDRDPYCRECRYFLDKNLTTVKILDPNGKPSITGTIGLRFLDFPLRVGKEWSQEIDLRQTSTGQIRPYFNRFKVEAYEEVTVKAGTFKALRISWHQENRATYRWSGDAEYWWSPEANCAVKGVSYSKDWFGPWELESFTTK